MHWLYLFLAVIAETLGTTFLKMSNGFTQLFPSILAIALFCLALFLSAITLKYLAVGIVYAIIKFDKNKNFRNKIVKYFISF